MDRLLGALASCASFKWCSDEQAQLHRTNAMEGAPLDAEAMNNRRSIVEGKLYDGKGELGDESLEGG